MQNSRQMPHLNTWKKRWSKLSLICGVCLLQIPHIMYQNRRMLLYKFLIKFLIALFLVFFAFGCSSAKQIEIVETTIESVSEIDKINLVLNSEKYSNPVYIGISPRMENRKKEIAYAKIHIANQIAMEEKSIIDFGIVSITNKNFFVINSDSNIDYNDLNISDIEKSLKILDMYFFESLTVVIAKNDNLNEYPTNDFSQAYSHNNSETPNWINILPDFSEKYYVGIGMADKYSSIYKSILVADVNAAQQIAVEINSVLRLFSYDKIDSAKINGSRIDVNDFSSGSVLLSKAIIYGFQVIDRWIDPRTNCCYSLAIAKRQED